MASAPSDPATGTDTVVCYCKMPGGIILRAGEWYTRTEGGVGGVVREVKEWRQTKEAFTVAGPAVPYGQHAKVPVVGGYAMTVGVPRDLWEAWLADNKESQLVKNNIIFASPKVDYAGKARELEGTKTGLEPLNRGHDPRVKGSERLETMEAA